MGVRLNGDWNRIDGIMQKTEAEIQEAVKDAAALVSLAMQDTAVILAPVDTGMLRQSIEAYTQDDGDTIRAGIMTNLEYAPFVEYGTGLRGSQTNPVYVGESPLPGGSHSAAWKGQNAQPVMRPALYNNEQNIVDIVTESVRSRLDL